MVKKEACSTLRGVFIFILRPGPVAFVLDGIFLFLSGSGIRKMDIQGGFSLFHAISRTRHLLYGAMHERTDGRTEETKVILRNPPNCFN